MYYSQITALFKCLRMTNLHFVSVVSFQQEPLRAHNRWSVRPDPKFCFSWSDACHCIGFQRNFFSASYPPSVRQTLGTNPNSPLDHIVKVNTQKSSYCLRSVIYTDMTNGPTNHPTPVRLVMCGIFFLVTNYGFYGSLLNEACVVKVICASVFMWKSIVLSYARNSGTLLCGDDWCTFCYWKKTK